MSFLAAAKALTRDACGQLLLSSGVTSPALRLHGRLSIVTFHRVLTEGQRQQYPLPGLAVTPDELDAHLEFATRHFRCVSLTSALDLMARDQPSRKPLLAITFDDGQLDNYQNALPVLERHGVTASFFVPSQILEDSSALWHDAMATSVAQLMSMHHGSLDSSKAPGHEKAMALVAELQNASADGRPARLATIEGALEVTKQWSVSRRHDWIRRAHASIPQPERLAWDGFMSVAHMKDLIARGHEIGSHSHSHPLLPQCSDEELLEEIAGSKQALEAALGTPVTTFCYPNGSTDQRSVTSVRRAGYRAAVTTQWGSNPSGSDLCLLQRFDMNARNAQDRRGRFSEPRLAWRMSGLHPGLSGTRQDSY